LPVDHSIGQSASRSVGEYVFDELLSVGEYVFDEKLSVGEYVFDELLSVGEFVCDELLSVGEFVLMNYYHSVSLSVINPAKNP